MPKEAHEALERQATKKGLTGERRARYVFGALAKMKKKGKDKRAGIRMEHVGQALYARLKGGY